MGLADSKHFLHLVRAMVAQPGAGSRAWAAASETPKATAYRLLRPFRFHGAIDGNNAAPRRVLRLAAELRKDRAVPHTTLHRTSLLERMQEETERMQLAFQSAANKYGFFEEATTTVRVDTEYMQDLLSGIAGGGSIRSDAGRTAAPQEPLAIVYQDDLSKYPPPTVMGGIAVTDPTITYMDLLSHPRAGAHAEFLDGVLVRAGLLPERT